MVEGIDERTGTVLGGKYRLEEVLGTGGMGTVYRGRHELIQRAVAVKVLHDRLVEDESIGRRFLREAQTAARLKHPNIVEVLDMGRDPDGTTYLVLELLDGMSLRARQKLYGRLSIAEVRDALLPAMDGLAAAHDARIIHRDIKPHNFFLHVEPDGTKVTKVLDFGVARVIDEAAHRITAAGTIVGTPRYMSPEQIRGDRDLRPTSDVWSMGVVLFECLAGRAPFEGRNVANVMASVMRGDPPALRDVAPSVPAPVAAVIDGALHRDPGRRPQDMRRFRDQLAQALDEVPVEEPVSTTKETVNLAGSAARALAGLSRRSDRPPDPSAPPVVDAAESLEPDLDPRPWGASAVDPGSPERPPAADPGGTQHPPAAQPGSDTSWTPATPSSGSGILDSSPSTLQRHGRRRRRPEAAAGEDGPSPPGAPPATAGPLSSVRGGRFADGIAPRDFQPDPQKPRRPWGQLAALGVAALLAIGAIGFAVIRALAPTGASPNVPSMPSLPGGTPAGVPSGGDVRGAAGGEGGGADTAKGAVDTAKRLAPAAGTAAAPLVVPMGGGADDEDNTNEEPSDEP